jgi:hypothetical protein
MPRALIAAARVAAWRRPSTSPSANIVTLSTQAGMASASPGKRDALPAAQAQSPVASNPDKPLSIPSQRQAVGRWRKYDRLPL